MVPYIFSSLRVKKQIVLALESKEIQFYPKHLNKEQRYRRQRVKAGTGSVKHAERARELTTISLETSWECSSEAAVGVWQY